MSAARAKGDRVLLSVVFVLLGLGSLTVFSSSTAVSSDLCGSSTAMFVRHLVKVALGLALMLVLSRLDYRLIRRLALPLVGAAMVLLVMTLIPRFPLAVTVKGATRWLDFGFLVVQPAELAKLALVVYVAAILSQGEGRIRDWRRGLVPILTVLGIFAAFLIKQPNFGNVLTLGLLTALMLFVGGARLTHLTAAAASTAPAVLFLGLQRPHVLGRLRGFFAPGEDPLGTGYQLHQAMVALGSGGLLGVGPGAGRQADFVPDSHTDFVFAILGEEFGLFGTLLVVALFGVFLWRGARVARSAKDLFGRYLAIGVTGMIGIVAFLNIAVVLGLAPTAGLPLPFLSYGGSSMLVNLGGVGILLSIAARSPVRRRRVVG